MTEAKQDKAGLRLGIVVGSGAFFAVWSHFYDLWKLPPRFTGSVGLILGGDVLPQLVAPLAVVWLVLREPLSHYGWKARPVRPWLRDALLAWLAVLPIVLWMSVRPDVQAFYPSPNFPPAREHAVGLVVLWMLHHAPQLFSLEFLFRGFLLLPLARRFGVALAIALLVIPYVILHRTKPAPELLLAAVGGVAFSIVAWRNQSFLPAFLAHWLVAMTTDVLCFLQRTGVR